MTSPSGNKAVGDKEKVLRTIPNHYSSQNTNNTNYSNNTENFNYKPINSPMSTYTQMQTQSQDNSNTSQTNNYISANFTTNNPIKSSSDVNFIFDSSEKRKNYILYFI